MKVTTKDFQILKGKHEFEFPVGITVIQGKTGSGKTTLFYAIEDCLVNPAGVDDVINWDAKNAQVTIENKESKITWIKTQTSSEYIDELTGKNYPKASKIDSTNLGDLGFYIKDDDVVNIQDEWKILFPFGLKDTEMFRLFEDIFNISCSFVIIDDYKKDEKEVKSQINQTVNEINTLTQTKNTIDNILSKVSLQDIENYLNTINTKKAVVTEIQEDFNNLSKNYNYKNINIPDQYDATKLVNTSSYYNSLLQDYNNYNINHKLVDLKLPKEKQFEFKENPYQQDYSIYSTLKQNIETYTAEIQNLDNRINELNEEISKIKVCPTCGRPLEE